MRAITLKECRVLTGSTQKEIAQAVGVCTDTIYRWEIGKHFPTLTQTYKMIDFFNFKGLNVSLDDINFL